MDLTIKEKEKIKHEILKTLDYTEHTSTLVSKELCTQYESLEKTEKKLDKLEKNLSISETLIKNINSIFSAFWTKSIAYTKVEEQTNFPNESNEIDPHESSMVNNNDNRYGDFYGSVMNSLKRIETNAKEHGKTLVAHNEKLDKIIDKTDKNDSTIKKLESKIKS